MAARYTSKQARMALRFWRKKLAESLSFESEKDQEDENKDKKSKKKDKSDDAGTDDAGTDDAEADNTGTDDVETDDAGTEDDFDLDAFMSPEDGDDSGDEDPEAKIANLEAEIEELKAKLAKYEGGDEGGDEDSDEDLEDGSDDEEDSDEEGDSGKDGEGDSGKNGDSSKKVDESKKYKPNTVGAVIQLLERFDPKSKLMIRMNPGKYVCMPIDVSGKLRLNGHGCTYMDIAKGAPVNEATKVPTPAFTGAFRQMVDKFIRVKARLEKKLGKKPSAKQLADEMDLSNDQIGKLEMAADLLKK